MKKDIYILAAMILGVLLGYLTRAAAELVVIFWLMNYFKTHNPGMLWSNWLAVSPLIFIGFSLVGAVGGYWLGQKWWKIIYVEERYRGWTRHKSGFTLIELLVVIAIIGIMASMIFVSLGTATKKARDVKRKVDLSQIGRLLSSSSCYLPNAGAGDYDILSLVDELSAKYPQYASYASRVPKDPKAGTDDQAFYRYTVSAGGVNCALYANLEKTDEPVTLPNLTAPTPGGGTGVLQTQTAGWNGTNKYFQISR